MILGFFVVRFYVVFFFFGMKLTIFYCLIALILYQTCVFLFDFRVCLTLLFCS